MSTRKIIFWLHLVTGLVAGIAIAIMSFTGAALAFERQLIAWAERDARQVAAPPANAVPLSLDDLLRRVHAARPELRLANVTLDRGPRTAVALGVAGSTAVWWANPYTAELREASAPRMRAFMGAMRQWHTHLNASFGEFINANSNALFLFLCLSGLWLWWPAAWTRRVLRPAIWFQPGAQGRARDWNWHNVFGFWSLPVLIVLTGTGVVMSYRSVNALMFRLAGDPLPAVQSSPPPRAVTGAAVPKPAAPRFAPAPPPVDSFVAAVKEKIPAWETMTVRWNPQGHLSANVHYSFSWPPFTTATVTLDPASGELQQRDAYAAQSAGRRARMWVRLGHSGEALGWPGQLVAGLACLAGCMLVWTGASMAIRRFAGWSKRRGAQDPDRISTIKIPDSESKSARLRP